MQSSFPSILAILQDYYGDISANLDQAMGKNKQNKTKQNKKKKRKYMQKKKKKKKTHTHTPTHPHTQFLRPIWPKFCIWEEFLIIFLLDH